MNENMMNAVTTAQNEVERLSAMMKEAKAKLAAAKKANQKSRPVRLSTFTLTVAETKGTEDYGTFLSKSDVHYCTEKNAIDILTDSIKTEENTTWFYKVWKTNKADSKTQPQLVEQLWIDQETKQIVIE